jgi:beta-xylosidase
MSTDAFVYANPHLDVEPGVVRDPFIVRVGDRYYLTGTLRPIWAGPNPGVPLWSSPDLIEWTNHGLLIDRNTVPEDAWYRDRWWAPEIHHDGTWFYLTVGCRNETLRRKHGVAIWRAKEITGPYTLLNPERPFPEEPGQFYPENPQTNDKYISNDASLFTDDDGRQFIFWACWRGIWQAEIELPSCRKIGEAWLAVPAASEGWATAIEGPVAFRHGRYYYLFVSGFGNHYEIGVWRSETITGPWEPQPNNPIIRPRAPLTHVGHNGVFRGPDGRWWISYIMQFNGKASPERLGIDPIGFNEAGWVETDAPTLGTQIVPLPPLPGC